MNARLAATLLTLLVSSASGQDLVASVSQGTNMALALSPDGGTLVVDLMGGLWSLPIDGGGAVPLVPRSEMARNPRFSPDGRQIVYQQYTRGHWDVWLLDVATRSRRRLTSSRANEIQPDFAADGRSIVFVSDADGAASIYRLTLATESLTRLTFNGEVSWPTVSASGEIAYVEHRDDDWALRVLPGYPPASTVYSSRNPISSPSWRPGGGVLAFTEWRDGRESDLRMVVVADVPVTKTLTAGEDVFGFRAAWSSPAELIYAADGRIWRRGIGSVDRQPIPLFAGVGLRPAPHNLHTNVALPSEPEPVRGIRAPRTAASGKEVAFTALGDLWLRDSDGELRQLTDDAFVDIDPAFSPDGRTLVFASDRAGNLDIWSLDLEDGRLSRLSSESAKSFDPVVSPDGRRVAYLATLGFGPWAAAELRILELGSTAAPQTLTGGLFDAGDLAWAPSGDSLWVWARGPRPGSGPPGERRLRYEFDLEGREGHWNEAPSEPGREILADLDSAALSWSATDGGGRYVIQADRLFDGIGTQYRRHVDIHIDGHDIVAVVARGVLPLPRTVISARDYTVMPGLIDLHAHQSALSGERLGRAWLAYGVTTVREVDSRRDDGLERRESWASGRRLGPRLLLSARHGGGDGWRASAAAEHPVYDVLQLYGGQPTELAQALVRDAGRFGVPIFSDSLYPAIELGINGLEHIGRRGIDIDGYERSGLSRSYADVLELLKQGDVAVTPTLAAFGGYRQLVDERRRFSTSGALARLFTPEERVRWLSLEPSVSLEGLQSTVAMLARAGVHVSAGSDAPTVPYGLGLHAELELLSRAGLSNDQALRRVTSDAALVLGLERQIGSVEAGKLADLVIIDGNPLEDIEATMSIVAVVRDGTWLERESLLHVPAGP